MAMHDVQAVKALRDELGDQLTQPVMGFVWTSEGGLDALMKFHREGFNAAGAVDFLERRRSCAKSLESQLAELRSEHGNPEDDRAVLHAIRQLDEWSSEDGHLPNRARFVLNCLDELQQHGYVSMLLALKELLDILDALLLRFTRIRSGSSANDAPARLETTGPPEPRVLRLKSSSANC